LKRSVYSHKNLITKLEGFPKYFHIYLRMDHDTYLHLLSLVTSFIAEEDTVMNYDNTYTQQETGKIQSQGRKGLIFVRDFVFFPPTAASRTSPHTLRNSSRLGLFKLNLEKISLAYSYLYSIMLGTHFYMQKKLISSQKQLKAFKKFNVSH
jgi:hypothetical protein